MKSVQIYLESGEHWNVTRSNAMDVLSENGLLLNASVYPQRVEFVFRDPTALNSFSVKGPLKRVICLSRENQDEEFQITFRKTGGELKQYAVEWDKIIVDIPRLVEETRIHVSIQASDTVRLSTFRKCFESQDETLVLKCSGDVEVQMNFLVAVASSSLVRAKFNQSGFRDENHSLDLSQFSVSVVESVKRIMTRRMIEFAQVNAESIALMDYLGVEGWRSVWGLVRRGLTANNCLEFMRLADQYGDGETLIAGFKCALGEPEKEILAVSFVISNLELFRVIDPKALCTALAVKDGN